MNLEERFRDALTRVKQLPEKPANDVLLELYSLYKQATDGDATGERPGGFDFVGRAKFDAWARRAGQSRDDAMTAYVQLVDRLHG